jgi:hypothetical protein
LYQALVGNDQRNRRICADVVDAVSAGRSPLVLTERNEHLDRLEAGIVGRVAHVITLRAGLGKKQRLAMAERLTLVRTRLFFVQRRWHHFGETPDAKAMEYIRGLVRAIRAKVSAGETE